MPESDVFYHTDQGFWKKRDLIPKEPRRLHPWDFAGETQAEAWLSGWALV